MKLAFWRRKKPAWADVSPNPEPETVPPVAAHVPAPAVSAPPPAPAFDAKALIARLDRLEATAASAPVALTATDLEPLREQIALLAARIDALPAAVSVSAPVDLGGIPADGIARIRATLGG